MSVIRILPENVANKIAAGEVVERPASIVKELLENAIDAGSNRIEIHVEAGGKKLIRVEDDGCGMSRDDALLAFERHATSKIRSADDLTTISTLGFRGEALPSIASVCRLTLETQHASDSSGTALEIAGGRMHAVKNIARPAGTRIEARDLFYNVPARRKFLKSESTELGHIAGLAAHYALAHPAKSLRLTSFTSELLNAPPVETLRERLYQVMGASILEQMVEIRPAERSLVLPNPEDEDAERASGVIRLSGFVSRPEVQRLNRNQMYFFINQRLIRDRIILHSMTEAYRNILPSGMFPAVLIFIEMPPGEVDVNVHPSKTEVRFRHSQFVHDFARDTVRAALIAARPLTSLPPPRMLKAPQPANWHADRSDLAPDPAANFELTIPTPEPRTGALDFGALSGPNPVSDTPARQFNTVTAPYESHSEASASAQTPSCTTTHPEANTGEMTALRGSESEFPKNLRALGQFENSFIIAASDESLWIIDQHVAHERILFERHLASRKRKQVEAQRLLLPPIAELTPQQAAAFEEIAGELAANGFEAEPFGARTIAIKTAPMELKGSDAERLLVEVLDGLGEKSQDISYDALVHKIAASVACHAAIKINTPLDQKKMAWLLQELEKTDCPMTCPHGRPILLRYSLRDIQKAFKRI